MGESFLAIVRPTEDAKRDWISAVRAQAARDFGLHAVFDQGRLLVLASAALPNRPIAGGRGVVLGALFRRDGGGVNPSAPLPLSAHGSLAQVLLQSWWGGYVAFEITESGGETVHILRDPSGALPCYESQGEGFRAFYADIAVPVGLGLIDAQLDPGAVAHHLAYPDLRSARTSLVGVGEVLAGQGLSLTGQARVAVCGWTPWGFARADQQIRDRAWAVAQLREEIQRCVLAWAAPARSILLELSGGLDSSIVAACLRSRAADVAAVTLATPDPAADERRYASVAAEAAGVRLQTVVLATQMGDVTQAPRRLSPRPGAGVLQQVIDAAVSQQALALRPDIFLGGGGGDNLFCFLTTAAPAADRLRQQGLGPGFWRTVDDLARLHGATPWQVARLAVGKAWRRPRPWRQDRRFLAPGAVAPDPDRHPWLEQPRGASPGQVEHIAALMRIQGVSDGKARVDLAPVRYPLLSQPLMELCLRIPSWMWVEGGRDRSVAREAFADHLPAMILQRRSKGDFTGFCGTIYQRQRRVLKTLLLDGWLADQAILDRAAVAAYLDAPGPPQDLGFFRLLDLAAVEAWAGALR